jgi:hypothetical protein
VATEAEETAGVASAGAVKDAVVGQECLRVPTVAATEGVVMAQAAQVAPTAVLDSGEGWPVSLPVRGAAAGWVLAWLAVE